MYPHNVADYMRRINMWSIILPVFIVLLIAANVFMPYPWHASCVIKWKIPLDCDTVKNKIVNQIKEWETTECPGVSEECPKLPCGQKCLYNFTSYQEEDKIITATHETPKHRYIDDLTFKLSEVSSVKCDVKATSRSRTWYAVLDFSTNYCNLRNLIEGAGLSEMESFEEMTKDSVCTQYSSRDCQRY